MKKVFLKIALVAIPVLGIIACGGGGDSRTAAESFVEELNFDDYYDNYYLAKDPTLRPGFIIVEVNHGEYRAIDFQHYARNHYSNWADFFWDYSFRVRQTGSGYFEDSWGRLYETTTESMKDLEKVGGMIEKLKVSAAGEQISAQFGLSEARGIEIARAVNEWKNLKKSKGVTNADADAFSERVVGFKLSEGISAYEKALNGNSLDLNALIEKAAETNQTTLEHLKKLMEKFVQQ